MRKTLFLFVLKLVVASLLLFVVWEWKGELWYALLFRSIALPVYGMIGVDLQSLQEAIRIVVERFYNILPFFSLMLAAWGISWRRRTIGLLTGFLILVAWHIAFSLIVHSIVGAHQLDPTAYKQLSPWFLLSDALPFVLWVAIAYKPVTSLLGVSRSFSPAGQGNSPNHVAPDP